MYEKSRQVKYPLGLYVVGRLILVTDPAASTGVPLPAATQPVTPDSQAITPQAPATTPTAKIATAPASADAAANAAVTPYPAAFFAASQPNTARDMVDRLPG